MIYITKHKEVNTLEQDGYIPLNLWDLKVEDDLFEYNPYINELTGYHYIWKHIDDDIKGVAQYRRYLIDSDTNEFITLEKAEKLLKEYDIITTERYIVGNGIYNNLKSEIGGSKEMELLDKYYSKLISIEPKLEEYFKNTWFNPGNMIICKKEIFDSYCKWLFNLIEPLYKKFYNDKNKKYKPRLLGYLFERLLTYWILENKLNVIELEYRTTGDRV